MSYLCVKTYIHELNTQSKENARVKERLLNYELIKPDLKVIFRFF